MPTEPQAGEPGAAAAICGRWRSTTSASSTSRRRRRRSATSRSTVERGETIAFVGPSGAGKTTLVKLLVGLYQPQSGRILYNGIAGTRRRPRRAARADRLRHPGHAALLRHDPREPAVRATRPRPTRSASTCCSQAACDSLLARADRGLDTVIGEGGVKVSGGEKQRLSIARALLRRPHLLVFDEATSSLDSLTEEEIVDTIRDVAASGDVITILIAHRLSTIMHADRIYVLERGRIVETGPPRRAARAEGAVLRDVAAADRRAPRRRRRRHARRASLPPDAHNSQR